MSSSLRLDEKLARIHAGRATRRDFILAAAKDADIAFGLTAPGFHRRGATAAGWKTLDDYRRQIRDVVAPGIVDLVLRRSVQTNRGRCLDTARA